MVMFFRDRRGHVPYGEAGDRPTKDEFRRFMADFPDKYDYTHAKVRKQYASYQISMCLFYNW